MAAPATGGFGARFSANFNAKAGGPQGGKGNNSSPRPERIERHTQGKGKGKGSDSHGGKGGKGSGRPSRRREQGKVAALKDTFGFLRCAEREIDLFFSLAQAPLSPTQEGGWRVGDEVDFFVEERQGGRFSACGLRVLPKGTVLFEDVLEGPGLKGVVEKDFRPTGRQQQPPPSHGRREGAIRVAKEEPKHKDGAAGEGESASVGGAGSGGSGGGSGGGRELLCFLESDLVATANQRPQHAPQHAPPLVSKGCEVAFKVCVERAPPHKRRACEVAVVRSAKQVKEDREVAGLPEEQGVIRAVKSEGGFGFLQSADRVQQVFFRLADVAVEEEGEEGRAAEGGKGEGEGDVWDDIGLVWKAAPRRIEAGMQVSFVVLSEKQSQPQAYGGGGGGGSGKPPPSSFSSSSSSPPSLRAVRLRFLPPGTKVLFEELVATGLSAKVLRACFAEPPPRYPSSSRFQNLGSSTASSSAPSKGSNNNRPGVLSVQASSLPPPSSSSPSILEAAAAAAAAPVQVSYSAEDVEGSGAAVGAGITPSAPALCEGDEVLCNVWRTKATGALRAQAVALVCMGGLWREHGAVAWVHADGASGFIRCAQRETEDLYFATKDVLNSDAARDDDDGGGGGVIRVGTEVEFNVVAEDGDDGGAAAVGGKGCGGRGGSGGSYGFGGGGRGGAAASSAPQTATPAVGSTVHHFNHPPHRRLKADRLEVLPTGSVWFESVLASRVPATVLKVPVAPNSAKDDARSRGGGEGRGKGGRFTSVDGGVGVGDGGGGGAGGGYSLRVDKLDLPTVDAEAEFTDAWLKLEDYFELSTEPVSAADSAADDTLAPAPPPPLVLSRLTTRQVEAFQQVVLGLQSQGLECALSGINGDECGDGGGDFEGGAGGGKGGRAGGGKGGRGGGKGGKGGKSGGRKVEGHLRNLTVSKTLKGKADAPLPPPPLPLQAEGEEDEEGKGTAPKTTTATTAAAAAASLFFRFDDEHVVQPTPSEEWVLRAGDKVLFDLALDRRSLKRCARAVTLVEKAPAPPPSPLQTSPSSSSPRPASSPPSSSRPARLLLLSKSLSEKGGGSSGKASYREAQGPARDGGLGFPEGWRRGKLPVSGSDAVGVAAVAAGGCSGASPLKAGAASFEPAPTAGL